MSEKEYLDGRLQDQIDWYDRKSQWNQKWYKRLKVIEILAATSIPFITGLFLEGDLLVKLFVGTLGLTVTLISGILSIHRFQENWTTYRSAAEALQHEKYLFLTATPPYNTGSRFHLLVQRSEAIMANENSNWRQVTQEQVTAADLPREPASG